MNDITKQLADHLRQIIDIPANTTRLVLTLDADSPPKVMLQYLMLDAKTPGETSVTSRYELKLNENDTVVAS